ncbi:unnamed protein product [Cunninghamella blakesleeana]
MNIIIRQEEEKDINNVYKVNEKAFEQKEEADLVNKLRASPHFIKELSLVAEINNKNVDGDNGDNDNSIIGYILFTKIVSIGDRRDDAIQSIALAPLSVLPTYQKQGIGKKLIQEGLRRAKALGYKSVIVLGHEHYYSKYGFLPASQWHIQCPFPLTNTDVFRCIELIDGALNDVSGVVEYSKEFY